MRTRSSSRTQTDVGTRVLRGAHSSSHSLTHSLTALGPCRLECTLTHESDSMEPQLAPYYW